MFKDFLREIFSNKCQLISLRLNVPTVYFTDINFHQCLSLSSNAYSSSISNQNSCYCITLRYLHIRISYACFLEHLIEYVPNLKCLSVCLQRGWGRNDPLEPTFGTLEKSDVIWSNKVKKLSLSYSND